MKFKYLILSVVLFSVFYFPKSALAEGLSLGIYPPLIEIQTIPPSSPETPITIENFDGLPVDLSIELKPIRLSSLNNGIVELINEKNEDSLNKAIQSKIQVLDEGKKINAITLNPYQVKNLTLNVNTTQGDAPGDFYFAILFISKGIEINQSSSSQLPGGISTNLLLSIGPKRASIGIIETFKTNSFFESGPVPFTIVLKNNSKHLVVPSGNIIIKNMLGKEVGKIDILPQYVLADSKRYLIDKSQISSESSSKTKDNTLSTPKTVWKERFLLGFYNATLNLKLDKESQNIAKTITFFAFPTYLYFVIIIVIFVSLSIYLKVRKKL